MSLSKEQLAVLENRLAELSATATPEELAYISKSLEIVAGKTTALDIVQLADEKIQDLEKQKAAASEDLTREKEIAEADLAQQKAAAEQDLEAEKEAALAILEADILQKLQILEAWKNEYVAVIQEERDKVSDDLKEELAAFNEINDIPEGSTLMEEIQKRSLIEENSLPLVFGILSRSQENYGMDNLTTELWTPDEETGANILGAVAGCCPKDLVLAWNRPPQLFFFQGDEGTFAYKALNAVYGSSANQQTYPHTCIGAFFVKNTTDAAITSSFQAGGSSYSSLVSGCNLYAISPDADQTVLTSTVLSTTTTASDGAYTGKSVTVPAQSTVAIVMQSCANYKTTSNNYYVLFEQWALTGIRDFLKEGLEFDKDMTIRAWQCPGYTTPLGLWTQPLQERSADPETKDDENPEETTGSESGAGGRSR